MSKFRKTFQNIPTIAKYLLVFLVIFFISFLFPNNVRFKYQFDRGQTWQYEDLVAPFDYPILKPKAEIEAAKVQINDEFSPYYYYDKSIVKNTKKSFISDFDKQVQNVGDGDQFVDVLKRTRQYKRYGIRLIDNFYQEGIYELNSKHQSKEKDFVITVLKGNTEYPKTIQSIPDRETVNDRLADSLFSSGLREADFLLPLLQNTFEPNISFNDTLTQNFLDKAIAQVSTSNGLVKKGDLVIKKNGVVTDDIYKKLVSYKSQYEKEVTDKQSHLGVFIGYLLLTSIIVIVFLWYLQFNEPKIFGHFSNLVFLLLWLVVYSYLVYIVEVTDAVSVYMIPFCIVPIVVRNFYNDRLALFTHIIIVLIASFLSSLGYEFTFITILAGIVAVLASGSTRYFTQFFRSIGLIFAAYAISFLGLSLIREGTIAGVDWGNYTWLFLNAFLTLLAFPLIPLLEKIFGFVSAVTLDELSDMSRPLLKDLSIKAPGTLQHSLQVANLSEAAATKIGADAQLVKVAALYHDIGKMSQSEFYIENQSGYNPHSESTPLDSAKKIIEHVTKGLEMAKKNRLPSVITNFISSHHGTTRVEYFYRQHIDQNPGKQIDASLFTYPGPRPATKEETILMIADSLEAACKSLKSPTGQDIDNMINNIIAGKIANKQLEDSDLTFQELEICQAEWKKLLRSIHHVRVEYPKEKTPTPAPESTQSTEKREISDTNNKPDDTIERKVD